MLNSENLQQVCNAHDVEQASSVTFGFFNFDDLDFDWNSGVQSGHIWMGHKKQHRSTAKH
jgi:hypothetical protein